jgi:hypothetical protein
VLRARRVLGLPATAYLAERPPHLCLDRLRQLLESDALDAADLSQLPFEALTEQFGSLRAWDRILDSVEPDSESRERPG